MNIFKKTGIYLKGFTGYLSGNVPKTPGKSYSNPRISWFGGDSFKNYDDKTLLKYGFLGNSDVFSIISAIASESFDVGYKVKINGKEVERGITYDLIYGDEKEHFSSKMEKALINLLATGDVYIWLIQGSFPYPTKMEVLRSSSMEIIRDMRNNIVKYEYSDSGRTLNFLPEEILHIKNYNPQEDYCGNHTGLSKLQPSYKVVQASNSREMSSAHLFDNLGVSGIISDKNSSLYDEEEEEVLQQSIIDRFKGAHKAGQFLVTSAEIEVHTMGMSPKDLELTKAAPVHLRKIAAVFGVSSRPFNDPDGSTYNNLTTDDKNFFVKGVKKPLQKIILGIQMRMSTFESGLEIQPDYSSIESLQADQMKEIEKNSKKSDGVTKLLTDATLENSQKIFILVDTWKYEEEEAKKLVNG